MRTNVLQVIDHAEQEWEEWRPGVLTRQFSTAMHGAQQIMVAEQIFQPGTQAPPHWHHVEEHIVFLKGTAEVWCEGSDDQIVEGGKSVIFPANTVHGFVNIGEDELHIIGSFAWPFMEVYFEHDPKGTITREYEPMNGGLPRKLRPQEISQMGGPEPE